MGILIPDSQQTQHQQQIMRIGISLIAAFFFPILIFGFGSSKLVFINFKLLGKVDFITTLGLIYPILAGLIIIWAGVKLENISRPIIFLTVGIFPIFMGVINKKDFVTSSIREYNKGETIIFIFILLLIGIFIGSKILTVTDHISGRLIGGISGILFLILVLLPITGKTPIYFEFFKLLKTGTRFKLPGSLIFLGLSLIIIFSCYIFAALSAVLNLNYRSQTQKSATISHKIVFHATLSLPICLTLTIIFSGGRGGIFWAIFTLLIKLSLLLGGIIGIIVVGLWDLIDQKIPETIKGGDLFKNNNYQV